MARSGTENINMSLSDTLSSFAACKPHYYVLHHDIANLLPCIDMEEQQDVLFPPKWKRVFIERAHTSRTDSPRLLLRYSTLGKQTKGMRYTS